MKTIITLLITAFFLFCLVGTVKAVPIAWYTTDTSIQYTINLGTNPFYSIDTVSHYVVNEYEGTEIAQYQGEYAYNTTFEEVATGRMVGSINVTTNGTTDGPNDVVFNYFRVVTSITFNNTDTACGYDLNNTPIELIVGGHVRATDGITDDNGLGNSSWAYTTADIQTQAMKSDGYSSDTSWLYHSWAAGDYSGLVDADGFIHQDTDITWDHVILHTEHICPVEEVPGHPEFTTYGYRQPRLTIISSVNAWAQTGGWEVTSEAQPVPEPSTVALMGIGIVGMAGAEVRRRRKKKAVDNS